MVRRKDTLGVELRMGHMSHIGLMSDPHKPHTIQEV